MRLYKQTYKDRDGTQKTAAKWYLAFRDHQGRRRCWPLFKDKRESEKYQDRISQLCGCRSPNFSLSGLKRRCRAASEVGLHYKRVLLFVWVGVNFWRCLPGQGHF